VERFGLWNGIHHGSTEGTEKSRNFVGVLFTLQFFRAFRASVV